MTEPIAIVGMACRFPRAPDLAAYWQLLVDGVEAVGEPPQGRPELAPPAWLLEQTPSCSRGGFLENVELFEPGFFRISPREAARMDPQQRLLLEIAWEALEDAGQAVAALSGTTTGVFVGVMNADFARRHAQNLSQIDAQLGPGSSLGIASNRISFLLDLRGPSLSVDTLCSSSVVAVHLACQSLLSDESSPLAIAGGVNLILDRTMDVFYARAGLLSADGHCRAFDARARGIVRGEGAGLLVLKRLSRALADGDRIHALIRGSAVNQDGRSNGLTSPSRWSQEEVLRTAYRRANVTPGHVRYVEAHGTGTLIGDPIEMAALGAVMSEGRNPGRSCAIGSVKTNLGHLESAAGIASLIKTVLSLSRRTLAPSLNFEVPNPYARLEERNLHVSTRVQPWPEDDAAPALAGVSSFGMGGTNAHIVLEAYIRDQAVRLPTRRASLIPVSAQSVAALDALQQSYAELLASGQVELIDLAHSTGTRRDHYDHRRAIVAFSADEASTQMRRAGIASGRVVPTRTHKLVFVFPDAAACDADSGTQLAADEPVFREARERCSEALRAHPAPVPAGTARLFAFQVALAALWRSLGFDPQSVIGIGVGDIAARYVDGSLSLQDAIGRLAHSVEPPGERLQRVAASVGDDSTVFLELSPRPVLQDELRAILDGVSGLGAALPSLVPGLGERASILRTVAELYCLGFDVDWKRLDAAGARFVALGNYPWQRERFSLDPAPTRESISAARQEFLVPSWERVARAAARPSLPSAGEWLVLDDRSAAPNALSTRLEAAGHATQSIEAPSSEREWDRLLAERNWRGVVQLTGSDAASSSAHDPLLAIEQAGRQLETTIRLLQGLARRGDLPLPRLWIVTRGAVVLPDDTNLASLAYATLWGLARVAANEHPRLRCTLVDLPSGAHAGDVAELCAELLADADEFEIALRATGRFAARLRMQSFAVPTARLQLRSDAPYLITGGLGGLGLAAARLLVERGARHFVLLGRSGVTTELARSAIAEMTASGATIAVEQADVADRDGLAAVLKRHPVRGVIHAAGVMSPAMISGIQAEHLPTMMAAKVNGALNLHQLTASQPLDFFVLYSSVATLLGTPGQGVYAASNAYLDVLAQHRRAMGLPAISIAWTVVEDTGMAANADARAIRQLADRGISRLSARRAMEVLEQLLGLEEPPAQPGIVRLDLRRWTTFYPHAATSRRLAPLTDSTIVESVDETAPTASTFAADLRSLPRPERIRAVEAYLCTIAAAVLQHPEPLEPSRSLYELGIDSLTALELHSMVEAELAIDVTTERLLRGPTLRELATEIAAALATERAVEPSAGAAPTPPLSLRADAQLDPQIVFGGPPARTASTPSGVFLTGATGFLGAFLLGEMLEQTEAPLHCLVRAPSASEGLRRIEDVLGRHGIGALNLRARVVCVPGDLTKPRFGLSLEAFEQLAGSVDAIVHSGASVNFVLPYEALRAANVSGTQEVLRLAAAARGARVHHVSTIGVFPGGRGQLDTIFEDAHSSQPERLVLGYMRAKWVAEELVTEATQRGLDTTIFRPGTLSGHSISGAFNADDFVCALIKGCVQLGVAPDVDTAVNLVPVDYVSRALVRIALAAPPPSGSYHLVSPSTVAWTQLVQWIRELGYPLAELPYEQWRKVLMTRAEATGNALLPLLPLFADHENTDWVLLPSYDAARTERALAGTGILCPAVDAATVRRYVERFVVSGFLPRPR